MNRSGNQNLIRYTYLGEYLFIYHIVSRTFLAFLIGFIMLIHPVVGNGPGPDPQYTYEVTPINLSNDETVEAMYSLPAVTYGSGPQVEITRNVMNTTLSRPERIIDPALRSMTDGQFLADDAGDRYYRVDARITNGTFRLNATPVSARMVAEELAIAPEEAPTPVQEAMNGTMTHSTKVPVTLVAKADRLLLVEPVETERVSDPWAVAKLIGYALGVALILWAVVTASASETAV
jgi:hypothetical protein